jgi:hypothetical protein
VHNGHLAITNSDNTARELRLYEPSGAGTNFTALRAQAQASDITYTLPASLTATSTIATGLLQTDADGNLSWLNPSALNTGSGGASWSLTGNSGTNPNNNFLGTTDAQPLVIRTSNTERMRIGTNGNVGIGTTNPGASLEVRYPGNTQTSYTARFVSNPSVAGAGGILFDQGATYSYRWYTQNTGYTYGELFLDYINYTNGNIIHGSILHISNGNVGIGTSPVYKLHVAGTVAANGFQNLSDQRWKTNIKPIQNALDNVLKMQGVTYYWKVDEYPDKHFPEGEQVGFIAQEIEKVYPQVVLTDKDGYKSVDYSKITPVLVEAIKEQQQMIEQQTELIEQQQQKLQQQEQLIAGQQKIIAEQQAKLAMLEQKYSELESKLNKLG